MAQTVQNSPPICPKAEATLRDSGAACGQIQGMDKPDLHPAIRAARRFVLLANGHAQGQNSRAAFDREVQALMDALWALGLRPGTAAEAQAELPLRRRCH